MPGSGDLAAELLLDELEAELAGEISAHLRAARDRHRAGLRDPMPPAPLASIPMAQRLRRAHRETTDPVLRLRLWRAWQLHAEGRLGALDPADPGIFEQRNRCSRILGTADFWQLALELADICDEDLEAELAADSSSIEVEASAGRQAGPELDPVLDATTPARLLDRARRHLEARGYSLADAIVELHPVPRTFAISPGEVHVFTGEPRDARTWSNLWHELGHGVAATAVDRELPWPLARVTSRCLDEAIADRIALVGESAGALEAVLDIDRTQAQRIASRLAADRGRHRAWQRARAAFERCLYTEPEADRDERWSALARRYAGGAVAAGSWQRIGHLRFDPGSQASYLLAHVLAPRLAAATASELAGAVAAGAGVSWREVMAALEPARPGVHDPTTP